jgi:hypothetical protein
MTPMTMPVSSNFRLFFIASLLVLICSASTFGIWIESYIKKVDIVGIESIMIATYRFANGWDEVDVLAATYNEAGKLIKETRHEVSGALQFEYTYDYDAKGNMTAAIGRRMKEGEMKA